jgi:hypothetical protein
MANNVSERAKPLGATHNRMIEAAYALAKSKSEENAHEIMRSIPPTLLPALLKHMKEHANLFSPAIHAMVVGAIDPPQASRAEALFL